MSTFLCFFDFCLSCDKPFMDQSCLFFLFFLLCVCLADYLTKLNSTQLIKLWLWSFICAGFLHLGLSFAKPIYSKQHFPWFWGTKKMYWTFWDLETINGMGMREFLLFKISSDIYYLYFSLMSKPVGPVNFLFCSPHTTPTSVRKSILVDVGPKHKTTRGRRWRLGVTVMVFFNQDNRVQLRQDK